MRTDHESLSELEHAPLEEHVARFEEIHQALAARLNSPAVPKGAGQVAAASGLAGSSPEKNQE